MTKKKPDLSHIAEPLRSLAVPIADLVEDPENARLHPERNSVAVRASLKRFGQRVPVVVNSRTGYVEAGNARLEAAKQLGWTHLAAVSVDDDERTAAAFAIADNRTAELAVWDWEKVSDWFRVFEGEDFVGWEDFEIDPLLKAEWEPPEIDHDSTTENVTGRAITMIFIGEDAKTLDERAQALNLSPRQYVLHLVEKHGD